MSAMNTCETRPRARWGALVLLFVGPLAVGCASRAVPFNELGDAQVTVLRLQLATAAATQPTAAGTSMIPGMPPELQQLGQQVATQLQTAVPGLIPPGIIPGQQTQPATPPRLYQNQWVITAEQPLADDKIKNEILDIFGDADSFQAERGNCSNAGMAVIFQTPKRPQAVELVISLSCNWAAGYGFVWPHPTSGLKPATSQKLGSI
jgi:hypothetical protein